MELAVFPPYVAEVTKEPAADTEGRLGEITQGFQLGFLLLDIHGIADHSHHNLFIFETFHAGPCHGGLNDDCWILASSCSQAVSRAPPATICSVWLIVGHSSGARRANAVHGEPESVGSGRSTLLQHGKAKAAFMGPVFGRKD